MANRVKGEVPFKLGDREFILCFNHNALSELEDKLDKGIVSISAEMNRWKDEPERVRIKWVRALLWAGLQKHHPSLTVDDVGEMMSAAGGSEVMDAIGAAMQSAFSEPGAKDENPTNGADRNGIGPALSPNTSLSDTTSNPSGGSLRVN